MSPSALSSGPKCSGPKASPLSKKEIPKVIMDEREIEQGYANFHRKLNQILRNRDVKEFKVHVARNPGQAGKLSHCLGLSDELAEVEMYKAILVPICAERFTP